MISAKSTESNLPVYESLTEQVMSAIRRDIGDQVLVPDKLYSGYQISERLGVSRSPVRDALLRLAEEGTVRMVRNRGFYVNRPQPQDIVEIIALRLSLEVRAAGLAAELSSEAAKNQLVAIFDAMKAAAEDGNEVLFQARDQELHRAILGAAGNQRQLRIIDKLREETSLLGAKTFNRDRSLVEIQREHAPIVEAIVEGNAGEASSAMRAHLLETGLLLLSRVEMEAGHTAARVAGPDATDVPPAWI